MTLMTFTIGGMCIYQPRNILDIFLNRTIFRRRSDAGIFPADTRTVCDGKPETSLLKMIKNCEIWDPLAVNSEQSNHISQITDTAHCYSEISVKDKEKMNQSTHSTDQTVSPSREVSESAFEFLLAEILSQPAYSTTDSINEKNDSKLHRLDMLGYDVGYR